FFMPPPRLFGDTKAAHPAWLGRSGANGECHPHRRSLRHSLAAACATILNGVYSTLVLVCRRYRQQRGHLPVECFRHSDILTPVGTSDIPLGKSNPDLRSE